MDTTIDMIPGIIIKENYEIFENPNVMLLKRRTSDPSLSKKDTESQVHYGQW